MFNDVFLNRTNNLFIFDWVSGNVSKSKQRLYLFELKEMESKFPDICSFFHTPIKPQIIYDYNMRFYV